MQELTLHSERPPGAIEDCNGRGVWVRDGETADEIMRGAQALEGQFDVPLFISHLMVSAVLSAIRPASVLHDSRKA